MQPRPEPREAVLAELKRQERTVRWAALKIGCSPSHLHRILATGERALTDDMAVALAELLGVEARVFLPEEPAQDGAA